MTYENRQTQLLLDHWFAAEESTTDRLSTLSELISQHEDALERLSKDDDLAQQFQSQLAKLIESRDNLAEDTEKIRATGLPPFDIRTVSPLVASFYLSRSYLFEETGNSYYVLELFLAIYGAGYSPPGWILKVVASWFHRHLKNPDPEYLSNLTGLTGHSSKFHKIHQQRSLAISDMRILIQNFGLSELNAARAVVEMHGLENETGLMLAPRTMKHYYREYFHFSAPARSAAQMTDSERTKFVYRIPPAIRKKIKQK